MSKAYSYLYSRKIDGGLTPHRIQNIVYRDYCNSHGLQFCFGITETNLEGTWHGLLSLLEQLDSGDQLLFYSLSVLKASNFPRDRFFTVFKEKKLVLHFCSENLSLTKGSDLTDILYDLQDSNTAASQVDILTKYHNATSRNYFERMSPNKPDEMKVSKEFGQQYWDGDRRFGYGGYSYDGRWQSFAESLIKKYQLTSTSKVLDVGCGKGFVLYELKKLVPGITVVGLDISEYAIENTLEEIKNDLISCDVRKGLSFKDRDFDLALSIMTYHNFELPELTFAIGELERVSKKSYIAVESYRNEEELCNLQCWALTCESFLSPREWRFLFDQVGYHGDYEFLYFT